MNTVVIVAVGLVAAAGMVPTTATAEARQSPARSSSDNSIRWTTAPAPPSGAFIAGLSCANEGTCVAVGGNYSTGSGVPTIWRWDGYSWSSWSPGGDGTFLGVSCASSTFCAAVGAGASAAMWNGSGWFTTPMTTGALDVSCVGTAIATGQCTAIGIASESTASISTWTGGAWETGALGVPSTDYVPSISCVDAFCEAVSGGPNAWTAWRGSGGWHVQPDGQQPSRGVVSCYARSTCRTVWSDGPVSVSCAIGPFCARAVGSRVATWNGTGGWTSATAVAANYLYVACSRANVCFAVGTLVSGQDPSFSYQPAMKMMVGGWIALGDSYSSGEGNPAYYESAGDCHQSISGAWPELAPTHPFRYLVACSGAHTTALMNPYGDPPQLPQVDSLTLQPDVITLTWGGDDAGFKQVLIDCFEPHSDCFTDGKLSETDTYINTTLLTRLSTTYHRIRKAAPRATVVAVGYPNLFATTRAANQCSTLGEDERSELVNVVEADLDRVISEAAGANGVSFVSTMDAFQGHELCTVDPYVIDLKTLSAGSGHPNAQGQAALANFVDGHLPSMGF